MSQFFAEYSTFIIFLHILAAIIWLGGMIVLRYAVHYSILKIDDAKTKLERTLENLKRFFNMVIPSILILYITAIIMIFALELSGFAILKEIILVVMTAIFIVIFIKRRKAAKLFKKTNYMACKKELEPISKYLIPINIVLALLQLYLGVILRGF